jgi:hypothetical protein
MYSKTSLTVQHSNHESPSFESKKGVRQGDNLSPTLFNIYLKDLPQVFENKECDGVRMGEKNLNCLLYADDLILISTSKKGMTKSLNLLQNYCAEWDLKINSEKTKCMVINSVESPSFSVNNIPLEIVNSIKYLGIEFSSKADSRSMKNDLYKRGLKAYFKLMGKFNPKPSIKIMLHLFDHIVKPILLYCCEIWTPINLNYKILKNPTSPTNDLRKQLRKDMPHITKFIELEDPIEKLHLKFCKYILGVNIKACNLAVYSELGRYPLFIDATIHTLKYHNYILYKSKKKLLKYFYSNFSIGNRDNKLTQYTTDAFTITADGNTNRLYPKSFYMSLKNKLKADFQTYWKTKMSFNSDSTEKGGNKMRTYNLFKQAFTNEKFLEIKSLKIHKSITQFRISAHKLKIESCRYRKNESYIVEEDRKCEKCSMNKSETELHFMIECPYYTNERAVLFNVTNSKNAMFSTYTDLQKFIWLCSCEDNLIIQNVGKFLSESFDKRLLS